jgi:hypothetical protein
MPAFADKDMPPPVALHVEGQGEASDLPVTVEAAGRSLQVQRALTLPVHEALSYSCMRP